MKRLLILEDDAQFRTFLETILSDAGYAVTACADGRQGLRLLEEEENRFDLILTDIFMPDVNGLELMREMRNKLGDTQVIAMSGGGRGIFPSEVLPVAEAFGAHITLDKPFTKKELLPLVKKLLGE